MIFLGSLLGCQSWPVGKCIYNTDQKHPYTAKILASSRNSCTVVLLNDQITDSNEIYRKKGEAIDIPYPCSEFAGTTNRPNKKIECP